LIAIDGWRILGRVMNDDGSLVGMMVGSYRITGELSRGGMGAVYRAEHSLLDRIVAVKLLRPDLTENHEVVVRFMNEAKAASAIRHPGIIEVLDFGHAADGRAYLVMEMLQGESLAQRIDSRGRLPEREAAQIARGIASALTAAHGKGIVHRDLKPDNVFLIPDPDLGERPKVLDFGIAKLGDLAGDTKFTQTGALMGTPLYMAPEQARAASGIDHRADLYSLGCMLYEMLVGEPPFIAIGAGEIIALQLFGVARRPSERVPGISPTIDQLVMRLLEKEPRDRLQTASQVGQVLDGLGRGPVATLTPLFASEPRAAVIRTTEHVVPAKRSRGVIAGMIAVTVLAGAIVAAVLMRADQTKPATAPVPPDPPIVEMPVAPATPVAQPPEPPVAQEPPVAPVTEAAKPIQVKPDPKREKPAVRDQSGSAGPARYTPGGSPMENDVD
jgi:serine/threonine-protein kinase